MKEVCSNCAQVLKLDDGLYCTKEGVNLKLSTEIEEFSGMGCFDDGIKDTYESREYCRDIECKIQKIIDDPEKDLNKQAKKYCRDICDAYKFHQWLKENDYEIRKVR